MYSPDYYLATNAAYETLMAVELELPVRVLKITKQFEDVSIVSYSEAARRNNKTFDEVKEIFGSDFGYLYRSPCDPWKAIIFYNDKKSIQTIRFTIAHELGHYVLGHLTDDDVARKEANCFARNILCPIPIGTTLLGNKIDKYVNTFDISEPMAEVALEHMRSDLYYISDKLYSEVSDEYEFYQLMRIFEEYIPDSDIFPIDT